MKLVSGEEIIGRYVTESTHSIMLSHVRTIGLQQDNQGRFGVGMMDYVVSNKDCNLDFKDTAWLVKFEPSREIEKAYLSNTSGLQLA